MAAFLAPLVVAGASALAKGIGGAIAKRRAKKKAAKEEKKIAAQTAAQQAELGAGYAQQEQAERDLQGELEGQAAFDPEAVQAKNQSERATSSAIDKAMRSGGSSGEIMNMVSGLTARGQMNQQNIGADTEARRRQARVAAKAQGVRATQAGLAGKQAKLQLEDKGYQKTVQASDAINRATGEMANYYGEAATDLASSIYAGAQTWGEVHGKEMGNMPDYMPGSPAEAASIAANAAEASGRGRGRKIRGSAATKEQEGFG